MHRRPTKVMCVAAILLAATVLVFLVRPAAKPPWERIPIALVGYTNDASGFPLAPFSGANVPQDGYALFRAHNPTRRHFQCHIGPLLVTPRDAARHSIQLGSSSSGHFYLGPGETVMFATPVPEIRGHWQAGLALFPLPNQSKWQSAIRSFLRRRGLDPSEKTWFCVSQEVQR